MPSHALSFQAERLISLQADQDVVRGKLHLESSLFLRGTECPIQIRRLDNLNRLLQHQVWMCGCNLFSVPQGTWVSTYISLSVYWFEKHILRPDRVVSKRPLGAVRVVDSVGRVTVYGRR